MKKETKLIEDAVAAMNRLVSNVKESKRRKLIKLTNRYFPSGDLKKANLESYLDFIAALEEEIEGEIDRKNRNNKFWHSFRYLIPERYREEIYGDLLEMGKQLRAEGNSKIWCACLLIIQIAICIYHLIFFKLAELIDHEEERKIEQ